MRRFLITFSALFFLAACEPSVEDYVKDAEKREAKISECAEMGIIAAKNDKYCQMAMEAQGIAMRNAAGELLDTMTLQSGKDHKAE
jgi:hypothetical protein